MPAVGCEFRKPVVFRVSSRKNREFPGFFSAHRSGPSLACWKMHGCWQSRSPRLRKTQKTGSIRSIVPFQPAGTGKTHNRIVKNLQSWYFRQAPLPRITEFPKTSREHDKGPGPFEASLGPRTDAWPIASGYDADSRGRSDSRPQGLE